MGSDLSHQPCVPVRSISIHAPRVGSDRFCHVIPPLCGYFNPRSPCGERPISRRIAVQIIKFQSTLPVWGATILWVEFIISRSNFNPRSPCGERQFYYLRLKELAIFQSTLPVWGATLRLLRLLSKANISIHAPRVGSDTQFVSVRSIRQHFNPRSPCGERQQTLLQPFRPFRYFNPRSPCGERLITFKKRSG